MTSLPQRQHLLLVGWVPVRLNERARSGGHVLFVMPSHVLHLSGDEFRDIPHPTFFHIQCQNSQGALRSMLEASASVGSVSK
jgi:hypothetical protein